MRLSRISLVVCSAIILSGCHQKVEWIDSQNGDSFGTVKGQIVWRIKGPSGWYNPDCYLLESAVSHDKTKDQFISLQSAKEDAESHTQ
jgi:hypothetical protein